MKTENLRKETKSAKPSIVHVYSTPYKLPALVAFNVNTLKIFKNFIHFKNK